jgi:hypothetical protein
MARPRRGRRLAVCVVAALLTGGVAVVGWNLSARQAGSAGSMVREIEQMRDANGLFFRPSLIGPAGPSIAESAYGLGLLAGAGRSASPPWHSAEAVRLAHETVGQSSVWGAWYVLRVETATASTLEGDWAAALLGSLSPDGFFRDSSQPADDHAADLAATAAALEVVSAKRIPLLPEQRVALVGWLRGAAAGAANAYQACNAANGLHLLNALDPATADPLAERWLRRGVPPPALTSFESVLDAYGLACLAHMLPAGGANLGRIQQLLRPALGRPVDDTALLYHVAQAWTLAGGPREALSQLANAVSRRLDPTTDLVRASVTRVGTLDNSYAVTQIRKLRSLPTEDRKLAAGVHTSMRQFGDRYGPNSMLMAAVILRASGQPDIGVQTRAVQMVTAQLKVVTRDNAASWVLAQRLLADLGVEVPQSELRPWRIASVEDRDLAWLVLSQSHRLRGGDAPVEFVDAIRDLPSILATNATSLTMAELRAGVGALAALELTDKIPVRSLLPSLSALHGCPNLPSLYRPAPSAAASDCDFGATVDAIWLETFLDRQGGTDGGGRDAHR